MIGQLLGEDMLETALLRSIVSLLRPCCSNGPRVLRIAPPPFPGLIMGVLLNRSSIAVYGVTSR